MITRTFRDIHDLVELVGTLQDASIAIEFKGGMTTFMISNRSEHDAYGIPHKRECINKGGNACIKAFCENTDAAYKAVEAKIASGEWKKAEAPA